VVLEHPVLATEVATAEPTVTDDALGKVFAVFECAPLLLRRHTSANGKCDGQECVGREVECGGGCGGGGDVFAVVGQAE
jgi:hypothetical protein